MYVTSFICGNKVHSYSRVRETWQPGLALFRMKQQKTLTPQKQSHLLYCSRIGYFTSNTTPITIIKTYTAHSFTTVTHSAFGLVCLHYFYSENAISGARSYPAIRLLSNFPWTHHHPPISPPVDSLWSHHLSKAKRLVLWIFPTSAQTQSSMIWLFR